MWRVVLVFRMAGIQASFAILLVIWIPATASAQFDPPPMEIEFGPLPGPIMPRTGVGALDVTTRVGCTTGDILAPIEPRTLSLTVADVPPTGQAVVSPTSFTYTQEPGSACLEPEWRVDFPVAVSATFDATAPAFEQYNLSFVATLSDVDGAQL